MMLIESIVDNMNLSNREELIAKIQQASQPNPQAQQMQQMAAQVTMAKEQATAAALNAQAAEAQARAEKYKVETQFTSFDSETDRIKAIATQLKDGDTDEKEFERRFKIAQLLLKEKEINNKQAQPTSLPPEVEGELNAYNNRNQEDSRPDQLGF